MNNPITQTKIILPGRHQYLLSRQRLLSLLNDLLEYRLTLITAPAGYGKTSLLVDLASRVEYPVCWLALDPLDQDLHRFIHYLIASIQQQFPEFGVLSKSLVSDLGEDDLNREQVLRTIINDLYDHVQEHFALVLDDYHLIDTSPEVNHFINRFAQEMDENCHLVIASRSLLSLPDLPLMVGRSQVIGLSFEELAFLPEEFKALYQAKYQRELSDEDAESIVAETEGWITGFLLSAETTDRGLTEHGRAARAAGITLYDYLARQVLDQQTPEMQDFLLRTSLLEEFNEPLCRQALGQPVGESSWADLIRQLLRKNLFVQPVENGGTWLSYHHLFRDFLQQHYLQQNQEGARNLLLRLVEVYQARREWEKAYAVCRRLGDDVLTADYIASVSPVLVHAGRVSMLKTWLDELPPTLVEGNLGLLVTRGGLAVMTGDPVSGLRMLNRALMDQSQIEEPALIALALIRRAACHRLLGDFQPGLDDASQALGLMQEVPAGKPLVAEAEREIGLNLRRLGQEQEARARLEHSLACYLEENDSKNAAFVEMDLGLMEMNGGRYPAARSLYRKAYQLWEDLGNINQLVGLCNNLGVLDHLTGSFQEAHHWFTKGLEYARKTSNRRATAFNLASLGELALDLGALVIAEDYLIESKVLADDIGDSYLQIYLRLSMAALARRRGHYDAADEHLTATHFQIRDHPPGSEKGKYHLERGLLLMRENCPDQAREEFAAAREIFLAINLPVENSQVLIHLAGLTCLAGSISDAEDMLKTAQNIIQSLGTLQPLVPSFSQQEDLLSCLEGHLPENPFVQEIILAVGYFQSHLTEVRGKLEFTLPARPSPRQPLLDIYALGRTSVNYQGEPISIPEWTKQKTVRELFFYLLSQPEGASRDEICLVFWPDSSQEQLKKQFKNALYRLRRAVGKDTILYHLPTRLFRFDRNLDYRYDVEEFVKALRRAEDEIDPALKLQALQDAAALYQHPFAPSLDGVWTEPVRYRLFLDFERTMLMLAELQLAQDQLDGALDTAERLLRANPAQEAAWRTAMHSYAAKGDRSGIERIYQRCCLALAQHLGTEPSDETLALYRKLTP